VWRRGIDHHGEAEGGANVRVPLNGEVLELPLQKPKPVQNREGDLELYEQWNDSYIQKLKREYLPHDRLGLFVLGVVPRQRRQRLKHDAGDDVDDDDCERCQLLQGQLCVIGCEPIVAVESAVARVDVGEGLFAVFKWTLHHRLLAIAVHQPRLLAAQLISDGLGLGYILSASFWDNESPIQVCTVQR